MIGDIVQTRDGRWIELAPTHCPEGHRLGPKRVLVGYAACGGHGAATARGPAGIAIRPSTGRRSTRTAR
jgi:hypothetical protein